MGATTAGGAPERLLVLVGHLLHAPEVRLTPPHSLSGLRSPALELRHLHEQ